MNIPQNPSIYNMQESERQSEIQRGFITRVYGWMALGLLITTAAALYTISSPGLLFAIISSSYLFLGLIFGELILVAVLSWAASRLSPAVASLLFAGYAVLNGLTLSIIFLFYTESSIAITFGVTACTFGIMTLFGYTTQRDLTKIGSLLIMGLVGVVLASLANLFFNNPAIYWIVTYLGILVFVGLIAYDTQKLKRMSLTVGEEGQVMQKASIIGALMLYLDFINLFLLLLRLLGGRRR